MRPEEDMRQALETWRDFYQRRRGEQEALWRRQGHLQEEARQARQRHDLLEQVRVLLAQTSSEAREQARVQVEHVVTRALQYVFGPELYFRVRLNEQRKQPEAEFLVASSYGGEILVENRPQDARGGGVVDVVALALRLALLQSSYPPLQGPLLLDEPAKHVSEEYAPQVAQFLHQVAGAFERQVIMITHNQQLAGFADGSFRVEMNQGLSRVIALLSGADQNDATETAPHGHREP